MSSTANLRVTSDMHIAPVHVAGFPGNGAVPGMGPRRIVYLLLGIDGRFCHRDPAMDAWWWPLACRGTAMATFYLGSRVHWRATHPHATAMEAQKEKDTVAFPPVVASAKQAFSAWSYDRSRS